MSHLKTYIEVTREYDDEDGNSVKEKDFFYLLHWGLTINDMGMNYTVAICQNCKTGQVEMIEPHQIRIIGKEIKE
jgi:hypothetical protein